VSTLFRPTGPLPPGVYWVRRLIALALVVVVLLIVFWLWGAVAGGGGSASPATSTHTSSETSTSTHTTISHSPTVSHTASSPTTSSTHSSKSPSSNTSHSSTGHASKSATTSPTTSSSAAVKPCADKDIAVTVSTDAKAYPANVQPRLAMSVRNASTTACSRDVGQAALELKITTATGSAVWSSDDCAPGGPHDVLTLQPNQVFRTAVVWSRTTSKPNCPSGQPSAASGSYLLYGRNLKITSASAAFDLL
jgi:hypothetical protein